MMPGNQQPIGFPGNPMMTPQGYPMMQQQFNPRMQQPNPPMMQQQPNNPMMQQQQQFNPMPPNNPMMQQQPSNPMMQQQPNNPMMQQQPNNPMMQQQQPNNPMMQQQQPNNPMMQQQQMYNPGQMNQMIGVNPFYFTMTGPGGFPQNQYTPKMAKEFKEKQEKMQEQMQKQQQKLFQQQQRKQQKMFEQQQKMIKEQQRKMEQEMKHRQFQEQQKKLKEFSTIGGRKMNADMLIDSIMGRPAPNRMLTPQAMQQPPQHVEVQQQQEGPDDFGDFLGGPFAQQAAQQAAQPVTQPTSQPVNPTSQEPNTQAPPQNIPENQNAPPVVQPPVKEQKKDLMAMMFECSDLTAPKEARSFHHRPAVKDVAASKPLHAHTYQPSQAARHWGGADDQNLAELFTLPAPPPPKEPPQAQPPPQPQPQPSPSEAPQAAAGSFTMPKWVTGEIAVPHVYTQVLEASSRDGEISTDALYAILVQSGLPRELLGHLWGLCNKQKPGQLIKEELYLLLAMVAVAQNNMNVANLDILSRCPQPPIPWLGQQPVTQPDTPTSEGGTVPPLSPATPNTVAPPGAPSPSQPSFPLSPTSQGHAQEQEDEFADFQSAGFSSSPAKASTTTVAADDVSAVIAKIPKKINMVGTIPAAKSSAPGALIGEEDKYAVFRTGLDSPSVENTENKEDILSSTTNDEFSDFKGPPTTTDDSTSSSGFADFSGFRDALTSDSQSTTSPGFPDFPAAPKTRSKQSEPTTSWSSPITDTTTDTSDDFSDFQTHDKPTINDKYASIKAMISDKSNFSSKPVIKDIDSAPSEGSIKEDDWGQLSASEDTSQSHSSSDSTNKFDSFIPSSDVDATSSSSDLFSSSHTTGDNDKDDDDWANFETATTPQASQIDWGSALPEPVKSDEIKTENLNNPSQSISSSSSMNSQPESLKVDPKKAYGIFGRNIDISRTGISGTGMSALDTEPPEFPPEMPDEEDDDDGFDKFGTFQAPPAFDTTPTSGVSSLVTPYGGLDDFGDFSSSDKQKAATSSSSQATEAKKETPVTLPSIDFNGWNNSSAANPDSQSMKSLELRLQKEGSPSGQDSQSVSSLEFATSDSRKSTTPQDAQSVASLELKSTVLESTPQEEQNGQFPGKTEEESSSKFGDFNSAPVPGSVSGFNGTTISGKENAMPVQSPRDIKELLTTGEFANLGDRYSGLTKEPQDSDRHAYDWRRCLTKCQEMICQANNIFNSISSSDICQEVLESHKGQEYIKGIVEIYRVVCRIRTSMKAVSISNPQLEECLAESGLAWGNLAVFIANTPLMPESSVLDFSKCVLSNEEDGSQIRACGVCLLNVDARSRATNYDSDAHKLKYGGRQYHAACANFWVNCVDSTLPALKIPELL